jgi:hypothetical protein
VGSNDSKYSHVANSPCPNKFSAIPYMNANTKNSSVVLIAKLMGLQLRGRSIKLEINS